MQTILVANPKGGSGKTTLATNVAGWLAGKRQRVALLDADPQRSSTQWLSRRPALFPSVAGFTDDVGRKELKDVAPEWLVVDSPAGLHGDDLRDALKRADAMVVPVSPSAFDMAATERFLRIVADAKAVRERGLAIALVAMRVDARTRSAAELDAFLEQFDFPLVTHLRDTQVYVYCARDGYSVFDLPRSRGEQDQEQWRPLTRWIAKHAAVKQS
ncbi:MAG: ParA family protein [Burkholderiales bacterium]